MITNADIARAAGVSTVTVSRVLNNAPGVTAATRRIVLEAAHTLGKVIDSVDRPKKVLVLSLISGLNLVEHLLPASAEQNISLLFKTIHQPEDTSEMITSILTEDTSYDGLITVDCTITQEEMQLLQAKFPVIECRNYNHLDHEVSVLMDDTAAGDLLTVHLIETGKTRIGYVHLNTYMKTRPHAIERLNGYYAALARTGLVPGPSYTLEDADVWDHIKADAGSRWDALIFPEAIRELPDFCRELTRSGIHIPEDLAFGVMGDGPAAHAAGITAIVQPLDGIARTAIATLVNQIDGKMSIHEPLRIHLQPQLAIRESSTLL